MQGIVYAKYIIFIFAQVTESHTRSDGLIGDFGDGSLYKNHSLYTSSDGSLKLQFVIYYDEVEVSNPLGSHKGKHKLGENNA